MPRSLSARAGVRSFVCAAFAALAWTSSATPAFAIDFVVTKTTDSNDGACDADCSLREAIAAANAAPGADRVVLSAGVTYVLSLGPADAPSASLPAGGDLDITDALTILGNGAIVDAGGLDRAFHVQAGVSATFENLTVRNGLASGLLSFGGGVLVAAGGSLTLDRSTISLNSAAAENGVRDNGGGVAAIGSFDPVSGVVTRATLTLIDSTISNNTGLNGGGIVCVLCTLSIAGSTVAGNVAEGNDGGGIAVFGDASSVAIARSTLFNNAVVTGGGRGGALSLPFGAGPATLTRSRIVGNAGSIGSAVASTLAVLAASDNWWGCSFGPGLSGAGCSAVPNSVAGPGTVVPYLVLRLGADPVAIGVGGASTATADLTFNSASTDTSAGGTVPDGIAAAFAATLGTFASPSTPTISGRAANVFTANAAGTANLTVTVDGQTVATTVTTVRNATTTSLSGNPPSPALVNATLTLNTAVQSGNSAAGIPAGTVTFREGSAPLAGCAAVALDSSGIASCLIPANTLTAGAKSFVAEYSGSSSHAPSTSAVLEYTVSNPTIRTPTITNASTTLNRQTTAGLVVSRNAADGPEVTHFKIVAVSGGALFQNDGTTPIAVGEFITAAQGGAGLRFMPAVNSLATGHVTVQASLTGSDSGLGGGLATADIFIESRTITTGADGPGAPLVRRLRLPSGEPASGPTSQFVPFDADFSGGVRVADADITGDGVPDVIAGTGPGVAGRVIVFDGATGGVVRDVIVGFPGSGGVFVAAGDVDGDGCPDVIVGDGGSSTLVHVFSGASGAPLWNSSVIDPAFVGGVRVAAGDLDGDGYADLIVGSGPGAASRVRVFSGATRAELRSFTPYGDFQGGVFVAAGDVNADGFAEVITGAGAGGGPHVRVFDGTTGAERYGFFAAAAAFIGGVRVAAGDVNGDGHSDIIAALGPGGDTVQAFDGVTAGPLGAPAVVAPPNGGGLFVSTSVPANRMVIDAPANDARVPSNFRVSGWAFQEGAPGTGVDAIHVWAYPDSGASPTFLGAATVGEPRPDVGAIFGSRYELTGYHLDVAGLADGTYDLVAFAHHSASGQFSMRRIVRVHVVTPGTEVRLQIDAPARGAVRPNFRLAGWALDASGVGADSGIEAVHIWAFPAGGTPAFVGAATLGDARPDVAAVFGARAATAGYHHDIVGLPPGDYVLGVYAKAFASPTFTVSSTVAVTVTPWAPTMHMAIDVPAAGPLPTGDFVIGGWAVALDAPTQPGIAAVHVWAYPVAGGTPAFLGAATLGGTRPDVGAIFGPGYQASGFGLAVTGLASGTWDIAVFPLADGTSAFGPARIVRITVP